MKRRSKAIIILLISFYSITMAVAGCKSLFCYVDYIDTLTCNYAIEDGIDIALYSMNVIWTFEEEEFENTCELIPSGVKNEYICKINMEDFSFDTTCTVYINDNETCGPFKIGDKFKPQAPFNLTITISENYNISWRTLYEIDTYRSNELAYELSYKKDVESWLNQKTIQLYEDVTSLSLLGSVFTADEIYVARVRAHPKNTSIYSGHWGSWSKPVSWRTPANENPQQIWVIVCVMLVSSVGLVGLLYIYKWPNCLWKTWVLIPNPALFFKPLYMVHHGDFKSWLGSSYYHAKPFDGMAFSEFCEVYSQNFLKNASRQDLVSLDKQKLLVTKPNPGVGKDCRKCDCNEKVLDEDSGNLPIGTQSCAHFNIMDDFEAALDESGEDSYPCVNLDSDNSNKLKLMFDHESEQNFHLKEGFLRPNINILDLVSTLPEGWEFQDSPSQECNENVFYNDSYDALSPDSGNSSDFGYPRICLDLDTIDSGFCDSECGSPVDSVFGNKDAPSEPLSSDSYSGEEEFYERNYVKQWVPNNSVFIESATHPNPTEKIFVPSDAGT